MATQGPFYWIDRALLKIGDGTLDLDTMAINAVLLASTQAVTRTFTGSSGDARYADLTAELATANGYTAGGLALTSVALSRPSTNIVKLTSLTLSWTLTGAITFKYVGLVVVGAANDDLLMVCDMDTGGGSVSPGAGTLTITPDATTGWGRWSQT